MEMRIAVGTAGEDLKIGVDEDGSIDVKGFFVSRWNTAEVVRVSLDIITSVEKAIAQLEHTREQYLASATRAGSTE